MIGATLRRRALVLGAAASLVCLAATRALACPACAGREDGGPALFSIYATMVLAPFFFVAIAWRVIRTFNPRQPIRSTQSRGMLP